MCKTALQDVELQHNRLLTATNLALNHFSFLFFLSSFFFFSFLFFLEKDDRLSV